MIFKWLLPVIGILLLTALGAMIVWWETDGRNRYMYESVLVLREDIRRGEVVHEEMLLSLRMDKHLILSDAITEPGTVIGKEAKHYVPAGTQLHPRYFEHPGLVTGEDMFIVKVPQEWLYSVPDTLRRKDQVVFFEVTKDVLDRTYANRQDYPAAGLDGKPIQADTPPEGDENGRSQGAASSDSQGRNSSAHPGLPTHSYPDAYAHLVLSSEPLYRTTVAYVKDSANREVVTVGTEERLDGSSLISSIEIPLTAEDKSRLEEAVARGSKFIVAYTEGGG
ncbi:SAF domain-containing protein [Paenibacillus senegalensis]|uniref:SAF domain-containing protein n=1 Tax=Paenibacillus senegalensis TaxID=1465766 RepID=UPI0012FCEC95|nr:SAF domain-containing protein [Paenibacillus senegalensis]